MWMFYSVWIEIRFFHSNSQTSIYFQNWKSSFVVDSFEELRIFWMAWEHWNRIKCIEFGAIVLPDSKKIIRDSSKSNIIGCNSLSINIRKKNTASLEISDIIWFWKITRQIRNLIISCILYKMEWKNHRIYLALFTLNSTFSLDKRVTNPPPINRAIKFNRN